MANVFCNRCGHRNPSGSTFCSSCGTPLDPSIVRDDRTLTIHPPDPGQDSVLPDDDVVVELDALPEDIGVLVVRSGTAAGLQVPVRNRETTLGRSASSDVFLDDVTVSRHHAVIQRTAQGDILRDLGSLNGTYVNQQRVDEAMLRHGDEVRIGKFRMLYLTHAGQ